MLLTTTEFEYVDEKSAKIYFEEQNEKQKLPAIGARHLQSLLLFFCIFTGYLLRVTMSVGIVAMTVPNSNSTMENKIPIYDWNETIKSSLLSAFFIGYVIMNVPSGIIGSYVSNKVVLVCNFTIVGLLAIITPPVMIYTGRWELLLAIRILQGLFQASMMPMVHSISARWAPPNERSRIVGFILSGSPIGTTVTLLGSGLLASTPIGWPLIFYTTGTLGILWVVIWAILGENSPADHPTVSEYERLYIENSLNMHATGRKKQETPWKDILTSLPVWAIVASHVGHDWGFWLLLSEMPTYINAVLGYDIKSNGCISAIPYLSMWILQLPVMYIADMLNKNQITTITFSRKFFNSIGMWGGSICLIALGYLNGNATMAIILYIITVAISCCVNVGYILNHMDLSPNFAGAIMSVTNTLAATGGLGAPMIVAFIVSDKTSITQWRTVFFIGGAILAISNLIFVSFGSGKVQPWNDKYSGLLGVENKAESENQIVTQISQEPNNIK